MLSKEEKENNRIPKQLAKALGIEKEDSDALIAFKENLYERTTKENIKLKRQVEQLETDKQKLIEKLEADKMEQFDDYVIYLIESYLETLKGE